MNPLDILLFAAILYYANRWSKKNLGVSYWVVMKKFFTGRMDDLAKNAQQEQSGQPDYQALFGKFCRVTGMDPVEAFKLARDHMGFGFSNEQVSLHFDAYLQSNCTQVPNYVEAFLDQGKEYIINAVG